MVHSYKSVVVTLLATVSASVFSLGRAHAFTLIDSFDNGPITITATNADNFKFEFQGDVPDVLGGIRSHVVNAAFSTPGATATWTIDPTVSQGTLATTADSGGMSMEYVLGGSLPTVVGFDLSDETGFEFVITAVQGTAQLTVTASDTSLLPNGAPAIQITSPGVYFLAMSSFTPFGQNPPVDFSNVGVFGFFLDTVGEASITIDEIRSVPEPVSGIVLGAGLLVLAGGRRRR